MKFILYTNQIQYAGGVERVITTKANRLVQLGHQVHILTSDRHGQRPYYPLDQRVNVSGLECVYAEGSLLRPGNLLHLTRHLWRLTAWVRRQRADALLVYNTRFDYYALPILPLRTPVILELHNTLYRPPYPRHTLRQRITAAMRRGMMRRYRAVMVLNADEARLCPARRVFVVPNSIQPAVEQTTLRREPLVLAVGRLVDVKQYDQLLQIWSKVLPRHPGWKLVIVGDGELKPDLIRQADALGLTGAVEFAGHQPDVTPWMQKASLLALTSREESFSLVIIEAMNQGLPVISYDCPYGPRNIIQHEHDGVLVKLNDPTQFALELEKLILQPSRRDALAHQGIRTAARYRTDAVVEHWLGCLQTLLPPSPAPRSG